jgi:hypothetical protein
MGKAYFIKNKILCYLLFILGMSIFPACRVIAPVVVEKEFFTGDYIYEMLVENQAGVETYSVSRMMIRIKDNEDEMNLRGSVRIKRDSAVLISVNAFAGIEAVRLLFTTDSVKMIDRINNKYFLGSYEESKGFIPFNVSYDMIQSIFFASPAEFVHDIDDVLAGGREYYFEDQLLTIRYPDLAMTEWNGPVSTDNVQFVLDRDFLARSVDFHSRRNNTYASIKYNSYYKSEDYFLPDDINFYFISHNLPFHAHLRLNRIEINNELNFPFNIPLRYSPVNR